MTREKENTKVNIQKQTMKENSHLNINIKRHEEKVEKANVLKYLSVLV